jgi:hypothetical protein
MKTDARKTYLWMLVLLLSSSVVLAKGPGKGKQKGKDEDPRSATARVHVDAFLGKHRDIIRQHYIGYADRRSLPPGMAKRGGDLPPGLQKQLQRNGHLPPGLEKRISPFPVELERRLPPLKPGLIRGIIGGNAIIMDKRTSVILDVFAVL